MPKYSIPAKYVVETSTLPPSVGGVATAIPVFLGYTQLAGDSTSNLSYVPTRINSMLEFVQYFGGPQKSQVTVTARTVDKGEHHLEIIQGDPIHKLYHAMHLFFNNGGEACYIVSVGYIGSAEINPKTLDDFDKGLKALESEDEPTLIVLSEACDLPADDYYKLCQNALLHCAGLQNRFCILDVLQDDIGGKGFRSTAGIGENNLMHGAAYYPFLKTALTYPVADDHVNVIIHPASGSSVKTDIPAKKSRTKLVSFTLDVIKHRDPDLYNVIKVELDHQKYGIVLPPSPAIAAVYARVDSQRGVWKSPANDHINSVISPLIKITDADQDCLTIDPVGGKSINAIRSFTGHGIVVWGARTLAGNDNEWRYVSVRRLVNMITESLIKATHYVVFEPNAQPTWVTVKAEIESYLYNLWQQGALAGSDAESSFFAKVGLGETMTQQDISEGKLIMEIGIAPVRPGEFIIVRFSHQLQII